MRKIVARLAVAGILATGMVVGTQAPAFAVWHFYAGPYDNYNSCMYAGYYYSQYNHWEDYECWPGGGGWGLMYWTSP